jgi:DNA repair protein RadC
VLDAARELVTRYLYAELKEKPSLRSPSDVRQYLVALFAGQEHETFHGIFLDSQHHVIASEQLFRGSISATAVYPREIVKIAMQHNASGAIFAHNHPSGVAQPSVADEFLTKSLKQALALVDVQVLDHFVVAGSVTVSFAERGVL